MKTELKTRFWISEPNNIHTNYGLQIYSPNNEELVKKAFYEIKKVFIWNKINQLKFKPFEQGRIDWKWYYIEFWCTEIFIYEIMEIVEKEICPILELNLEIGE